MLYITRHGQTDWNVLHKLQGSNDIPLNDEGRKMAVRANEEYAKLHFDICFCSPLSRSKETAELMLKGRDVPIIEDKRLMEMNFGEYEGLENSFSIPGHPINVLFKEPEKYTSSIGGAESFEELFARTGDFLNSVIDPLLEQKKDILIVGHGAVNGSIICRIKGLPIEKFWSECLGQCEIKRLV